MLRRPMKRRRVQWTWDRRPGDRDVSAAQREVQGNASRREYKVHHLGIDRILEILVQIAIDPASPLGCNCFQVTKPVREKGRNRPLLPRHAVPRKQSDQMLA